MHDPREIAYALLRVTLGIVFLFYGLGKFMAGVGTFTSGLVERFSGILPSVLVVPFGYVLPFIEVVIGVLLIPGLFTVFGLVLAGLLMIALTFGTAIEPDPPTVANNVNFALVIFVLLFLSGHNGYSLDRRRRGG